MYRSQISVTIVFCALKILASINSQRLEDSPILPEWIDPMVNMLVSVKSWPAQSSINPYNRDSAKLPDGSIILPAVYCLLLSTDHREIPVHCLDGVDRVAPGLQLYWQRYYAYLRRNEEWRKDHPTLYSFLSTVSHESSISYSSKRNETLPTALGKYDEALQLFGPYLMLPLMARHGGFLDPVLFLTNPYPGSNIVEFNKRSSKTLRGCNFVVAMNNPIVWHLPVNSTDPYSILTPNLRGDDPYAIDMSPLTMEYSGDWVHQYIGSDWDPSRYKTRGLLFMGVLREIMQRRFPNTKLFRGYARKFFWKFFVYVQSLASFVTVPSSYVQRGIIDPASSLGPELLDAPRYPAWISLTENILVKVNVWPEQSSIEPYSSSGDDSQIDTVLLPSIHCLELPPDLNLLPAICIDAIERHNSIIGELWTKRYAELTADEDWRSLYPTLIGFLDATLKITELTEMGQSRYLTDSVEDYFGALQLIGTYVIVPLIVDYRKIDSSVVWLTCYNNKIQNCSIESAQPMETDPEFILPLSNPRLWHLPVNSSDPYSVIPKLPPDHPRSNYMEPLMLILNHAWFIKNIHEKWNPEKYKTRGLFLIGFLLELVDRISDKNVINAGRIARRYMAAFLKSATQISLPLAYINATTPMKSNSSNYLVIGIP